MKRVPTLDHDPTQTLCLRSSRNLVSPIWTPLLKNATNATNSYLNVYSTSLTPYAYTCRDSMHMRKNATLSDLSALRGSFRYLSFGTFYFLLSTFYFIVYSL